MSSRRASVAATALLALGLAGCAATPAPDPTPTPSASGFATEEEAFAAAEETYRAYVDEMNAYYAGEEGADPNAFLTGEPLASAKDLHEQEADLGLTVTGDQKVLSMEKKSVDVLSGAASVILTACMDVSDTRVLDSAGRDVTPDRIEVRALDVELTTAGNRLLIVSSQTNDDAKC